jgi:PKD repeat protein
MFGVIELEPVVQENDKTRIDCSKSYVVKGDSPITLVEVEPYAGAGFITVSGVGITAKDWLLDYQYSSSGSKVVTLRLTNLGGTETFTKTINVVTAAVDKLFSSDQDLVQHEPDIMKWIRPGRNSWIDYHRKTQSMILDWLANARIFDQDNARLTKDSILVTDDVKGLSIYWTLSNIFHSLSNKVDDVFSIKAKDYDAMVFEYKQAGRIQFDWNNNAELDTVEKYQDMKSFTMVRR